MNDIKIFKKEINIEETNLNVISDIDINSNFNNNINNDLNLNSINSNGINSNGINFNNHVADGYNKENNLEEFILNQRNEIKKYMVTNPLFAKTLVPYKINEQEKQEKKSKIPGVIDLMLKSSNIANVGPTATLAGTIAELSLDFLVENKSNYSIIDNGGDIAFLNNYNRKKVIFGIYAGNSPLSGKIGFEFKFKKKDQKLGVCSSSASVGYSISYGRSDCVTILANQASIADGLATSIGNNVNGKKDEDAVENGLSVAEQYKENFIGALIIVGETVGTIGKLPKIIETKNTGINKNFDNEV